MFKVDVKEAVLTRYSHCAEQRNHYEFQQPTLAWFADLPATCGSIDNEFLWKSLVPDVMPAKLTWVLALFMNRYVYFL